MNEWTNPPVVPGYPESFDHGHGVSHTDHSNMLSTVHVNGKKVKTFKGESAWSNAQRHASDLAVVMREDPMNHGLSEDDDNGGAEGRGFERSLWDAAGPNPDYRPRDSRAVHPVHSSRRSGIDRRGSQFERDQFDRNAVRPTDKEMGATDRRKGGLGPNGEPGLTVL